MGEYARQYTLDRFGVDIGDDRELIKIKPVKRYGCSCGRVFITQQAKEQHQRDTGHINKGGRMTDCELLEMAAKAAGYEIKRYSERYGAVECLVDGVSMWWDPLTNDGEALRLAVRLGIRITNNQLDVWATTLGVTAIELLTNDPYAATRRAIVRAAAKIGEQIKRGHARGKQ